MLLTYSLSQRPCNHLSISCYNVKFYKQLSKGEWVFLVFCFTWLTSNFFCETSLAAFDFLLMFCGCVVPLIFSPSCSQVTGYLAEDDLTRSSSRFISCQRNVFLALVCLVFDSAALVVVIVTAVVAGVTAVVVVVVVVVYPKHFHFPMPCAASRARKRPQKFKATQFFLPSRLLEELSS